MKIETKFSCGDRVWNISNSKIMVETSCAPCSGTGQIAGADESKHRCPGCGGWRTNKTWEDKGWNISKECPQLTIGKVLTAFTGNWDSLDVTWSNYGAQKEKYEEQYMCRETGVGSGTLHKAEQLFATKEDAEAECKRLNKK